ncbi:MAG: hypothetical protein R2791_20005 [Saprospiraceae bacterium]
MLRLLPFFGCMIAFVWSTQHAPFFWDTVQLASKHAHHFYEQHLRWTPLPTEIDSGHPPVFGYYLAAVWLVFGKTLAASHWAMLPFLLLNIFLLYRIGLHVGGNRYACWLLPLVMLDPVVAGQQALVSPDVMLASGFLMAVLGITEKKTLLVIIGILLLSAISMRGMMTAAALFVWLVFVLWMNVPVTAFRKAVKLLLAFLPGFLWALWFLWWHHAATGWTGYHADSPWAPAFQKAEGVQMFRNMAVVAWRWLDFGRVFECGALLFLLLQYGFPRRRGQSVARQYLALLVILIVFLTPSAILYSNISAHRYFIPCFLALHFLIVLLLTSRPSHNGKPRTPLFIRIFMTCLVLAIASGNLWVYPRGISMGWDATLAHQPYYALREQAVAFLESENVPFSSVGSAFPNLGTGEQLLLNGDQRHFAEKDFTRNRYMFTSNIFNDFSENDFERLQNEWVLVRRFAHADVWIEIYSRKEQSGRPTQNEHFE